MVYEKLEIDELERRSEEERVKNFSEILNQLDNVDDKKKALWKEIYTYAITDRQNAYAMLSILITICKENSSEHAVHGRTIATYIEKMSRATDQLIKLAEIIRKAEEDSTSVDPEEMFDRIRTREQ